MQFMRLHPVAREGGYMTPKQFHDHCANLFAEGVEFISGREILESIKKALRDVRAEDKKLCGSCRWWRSYPHRKDGKCKNRDNMTGTDTAFVENAGPDFGCIHWQGRDEG